MERRFRKWVEKEGIEHARLVETAMEAFAGQYEADLGGYLFKKRLAREGEGKSADIGRSCASVRQMMTGYSFFMALRKV